MRWSRATLRTILGAAALCLPALPGCRPPPAAAPKPVPPAVVEKPVKESDLSTVRLTADAESRLGLRTAPVEEKALRRTRSLGGEVTAPPGALIVLSAPFAGTVREGGSKLAAGQAVKKGATIIALEPLLPAEARATLLVSRVEAEGLLAGAQAQAEAAKSSLKRAEQLLRDRAGSQRTVDDAQAHHQVSQAALKAAEAKRDLYASLLEGSGTGAATLATLTIPSPVGGMITRVLAVPGQVVGVATPLVEVLEADRLWIRVPVYVGDLAGIAADQEVQVGAPGDARGALPATARPVVAPPSADPVASTVDLFYQIKVPSETKAMTFAPGQRVAVTVPLRAEEESLVVPWSSVLHDSQGGTWVYEAAAPHTYIRRRVEVRFVQGGLASLARGPRPGALVVTEGAAELFGTEFGVGK